MADSIKFWISFEAATTAEQVHFYKNVKSLLPLVLKASEEQQTLIDELSRDLRAREFETKEYKTRAESHDKTNVKLQEDFTRRCAELSAEIDAWKKKDSEAKGRIDAYVESLTRLRDDLAQQKLQIDNLKVGILHGVQILNSAL